MLCSIPFLIQCLLKRPPPSILPPILKSPILSLTVYIDISEADVYKVLSTVDPHKASGNGGISPCVLKYCASALSVPLHHLFFQSVRLGQLLSQWKQQLIVPVYKSGDRSDVRNYRPVSLLCTVSKVPEKLIYDQIIEHVYFLLSNKQFGFLKGRSCALKLLSTLTHTVESLNKNYSLDIIFLDMRKAFDSVCHNKLLLKLQAYGLTLQRRISGMV